MIIDKIFIWINITISKISKIYEISTTFLYGGFLILLILAAVIILYILFKILKLFFAVIIDEIALYTGKIDTQEILIKVNKMEEELKQKEAKITELLKILEEEKKK